MSYTAMTAKELRIEKGSLLTKMASENSLIQTELEALDTSGSKEYVVLTTGIGTNTAAATTGVDLADGTGATYYGVFFAPCAMTGVKMHVLHTEAYVKDTDDANISLKDNSETPVTIFSYTPAAAGVAAGVLSSKTPETGKSSIAAGKRLDLVVSATQSSSGTGHAIVILEYTR